MKLDEKLELVAIQLLILVASTTLYSAISILINQKILGEFFLLGVITGISYSLFIFKKSTIPNKTKYWNFILVNLCFLVFIILGLLGSAKYYDISHDGQMYHQEAIIQLKQGWNPIFDGNLEENLTDKSVNELHISEIKPNFWINHYAKGAWYFAAAVYDFIGCIEYSKVASIYLLLISFLLAFCLLMKLNINKFLSFWIALISAFNPVVITQLFTFYIDGQLASLFFILIVLVLINYINKGFKYVLAIGAALIIFVNIKFTAMVYALVIIVIPLALDFYKYYIQKDKIVISYPGEILLKKNNIYCIITCFIIGIFIIGASPYITNTIDHKHPFYPLSGEEKVDIMSHTTPIDFKNKNIFEQIYLSIFSKTSNETVTSLKAKFPLSISENEKDILWVMDIRVGGFGPLYGAIFILMIAGMIIWKDELRKDKNQIFIIAMVIIIVSVLINPEAWWARYIPQLWILPIIFLILLVTGKLNYYKLIYILSICILISGNVFLFQKYSLMKNIQLTTDLNIQLQSLEEYSRSEPILIMFDTMQSNRIRLEEHNISYIEGSIKEIKACENTQNLIFSNTKICISDFEKYMKIHSKNYLNNSSF